MFFEVERIDGDYAYLKRTDEAQDEPRLVARALLPDSIKEGTRLKRDSQSAVGAVYYRYEGTRYRWDPSDHGK